MQYKYLSNKLETLTKLKKTIDKRFDIVAQQTGDLVIKLMEQNITQSLDNVVMAGYCFGGYIAAYTCRYLKNKTNQQVKALFGELHLAHYPIFKKFTK